MSSTCSECGATAATFSPVGPVMLAMPAAVETLRLFLSRKLDSTTCTACGQPLDLAPSVIMRFTDGRVLACAGPGMIGTPEQFERVLIAFGARGKPFGSLDELHQAVREHLRSAAESAMIIGALPSAAMARRFVDEHHDDITAELFAVALVGDKGLCELPDGGERNLAVAQAHWWFRIGSDARDGRWAGRLEDALTRSVFGGTVVPGAPVLLTAAVKTAITAGRLTPPQVYGLEATLATVFVAAGKPNPRSDEWARCHVSVQSHLDPLFKLDRKRLSQTLSVDALGTALDGLDEVTIRAIAEGAGLPDAAAPGLRSLRWNRHREDQAAVPASENIDLDGIDAVAPELVARSDVDETLSIADQIAGSTECDAAVRARVLIWMGQCLLDMLRPAAAFRALGHEPRAWEAATDVVSRLRLGALRAQAAIESLPGWRGEKLAFEVIAATQALDPEQRYALDWGRFTAQRVYRAINAQHAVMIIRHLIKEGPEPDQRLLHDYASALVDSGQPVESLEVLDRVFTVGDPATLPHQALTALRARVLIEQGDHASAFLLLETIFTEDKIGARALFDFAAALVQLRRDNWPSPPLQPLDLLGRLRAAAEEALSQDEPAAAIKCWLWIGLVAEAFGLTDIAMHTWIQIGKSAQRNEFWYEPEMLAWLATHRFACGDDRNGLALVHELPVAMAVRLGHINDVAAALRLADPIAVPLERIVVELNERDEPPLRLIQIVADLRRCLIERAQTWRGHGLPADLRRMIEESPRYEVIPPSLTEWGERLGELGRFVLLEDEQIRRLAPKTGTLVVFEWIETVESPLVLSTVIRASGQVTTTKLEPPRANLTSVLARIKSRMFGWGLHRRGNPWDVTEWEEPARWFAEHVETVLGDGGGHVVVIEPRSAPGLPWDIIGARRWTTSYISSWTALLDLGSRPPRSPVQRVGAAAIPGAHDAPEIVAAFEKSLARSQDLAESTGIPLFQVRGPHADRKALSTLICATDLVKLLCHGFVSEVDREVSLLIAEHGSLPPTHPATTNSEASRRHRYGWRDLQHLERTPEVVITAACEAAQSHPAPLGERVGIFRTLRHAGTRAFIAPRCDAFAEHVAPIVDDTIELLLSGKHTLAEALDIASTRAERHQPQWIARILTLEGDWR